MIGHQQFKNGFAGGQNLSGISFHFHSTFDGTNTGRGQNAFSSAAFDGFEQRRFFTADIAAGTDREKLPDRKRAHCRKYFFRAPFRRNTWRSPCEEFLLARDIRAECKECLFLLR